MMELVILSGPSGSGISSARFVFEELGYYIVENCPLSTCKATLDAFDSLNYRNNKFCMIVSIDNAKKVNEIASLDNRFHNKLVLLYSTKEEIIKRYRLSRHAHPRALQTNVSLDSAIELDIKNVNELISDATIYINTSSLTIKQLRIILYQQLDNHTNEAITTVNFISFGYKNGVPLDLDMMFDVRTLPNPYWVESLKELDGGDKEVIDYINSFPITKTIINNIIDYLSIHLKEIQKSGRGFYNIGIVCSGGKHRSTYVANLLKKHFENDYRTTVVHRDSPYLNKE